RSGAAVERLPGPSGPVRSGCHRLTGVLLLGTGTPKALRSLRRQGLRHGGVLWAASGVASGDGCGADR
ncbi:hypothetical protein ABE10_12545, partial [Bacillus toyonensis]|nr:hypothetical protein [Bacillus toyonensis]